MANARDYATVGKVTAVQDGAIVFHPKGTNYQLKLEGTYDGPLNTAVEILIKAIARKVWTVPSGGNFVTPIFGPPRIVQGRGVYLDDRTIVLRAGADFVIELPASDSAFDLAEGGIEFNRMVNCTILPGVRFELSALAASVR